MLVTLAFGLCKLKKKITKLNPLGLNYSSETCQKKLSEVQLGTKCEENEKKIFFVLVILAIGLYEVKKKNVLNLSCRD